MLTGQRSNRIAADDRRSSCEARRNVEVDEAAEKLRDGRAILPANAGVERELWRHAPVVGHIFVVDGFAEIFVGIAIGDGAGVGNTEEKVGKIGTAGGGAGGTGSGGCSGEHKRAARILLRTVVELLAAEIAAEGDVVNSVNPEHGQGGSAGLVTGVGAVLVGQLGNAAREGQGRRTPVGRILIVPGDSGEPGDILAILNPGSHLRSQSAELIARVEEHSLAEAMRPLHARIESQQIGGVDEIEDAGSAGPRALQRELAVDLIPETQRLVDARLKRVLVRIAQQRSLIVVQSSSSEIGQRIKSKQSFRLIADASLRNGVVLERLAGRGIVDDDGLTVHVDGLREIASALRLGGHKRGLCRVVVVTRPLIADEEAWVVLDQMANLERASEVHDPCKVAEL